MFTGWAAAAIIFFIVAFGMFLTVLWMSGDISIEEKDQFDDEYFL
jgi:hypothetical protein